MADLLARTLSVTTLDSGEIGSDVAPYVVEEPELRALMNGKSDPTASE